MVIVLTGGIASGKSYIRNIIKDKIDAEMIDTDTLAKDMMKKGHKAYEEVVKKFGIRILGDDMEINTKMLGSVVFNDKVKLYELNNIVHPMVREALCDIINNSSKKIVILESAIAIESGLDRMADELWYVYASEATRIDRMCKERGMSIDIAKSIIDKQMKYEDIKKHVDVIIYNDINDDVEIQIDREVERLQKYAVL